ncbi:Aldo/keto reductase [Pholiota molesta]|nr:Aldo/keto reductase [Pholiota molesta]
MPFADIQLNDGNKIPAIAFGSGSVNKGHDIHHYIEQAIDTGFTHLDTAQFYQNQESVGLAIRESGLSRAELYLTSKWGFGNIHDALNESLTKIGVKQLDLYLIHTPTAIQNDDFEGAWRTFEKIKEDGLAKSIGVSNFEIDHLQKVVKIARVKPAVNQVRLHPYNIAKHAALLEYHKKHGIITEAYGSLAPITKFPGGPVDEVLEKAAGRLGISTTQVVFLWVKAKGAVIVTTSSNRQHLEEYFAVGDLRACIPYFDIFFSRANAFLALRTADLTAEEVAAIDAAGAKGPPSKFIFASLSKRSPGFRGVLLAVFLVLVYCVALRYAGRGYTC